MSQAQITYDRFIIVTKDNSPGLKVIKPQGKGSVPTKLSGTFTNSAVAIEAINMQLNIEKREEERKKEKAKVDAEKKKAKRKRLYMEEPDGKADDSSGDESVREGTDNGSEPS